MIGLVTGGSRGIGRAICLELAQNGYDVIINYSGNEKAAQETKALCESFGVKAFIIKADVSNNDDVEKMFNYIKDEFETIDVLVNNAGITKDNLLISMSEDDFDNVVDINMKGSFLCMKYATKLMMKKRYGRIVNISSVVGLTGNLGQVNYAATKAGLIGMTKSLAKEVAARNITVNAVAPGFIESEMTDVLSDNIKAEILKQIPLKKMGKPEDVAKAVLFLVSENASYITGQVISVNGGMV